MQILDWYQNVACSLSKLKICELVSVVWYIYEAEVLPKCLELLFAPSALMDLVYSGCITNKCKKCHSSKKKFPFTKLCKCKGGVDCENCDKLHDIVWGTDSNPDYDSIEHFKL